MRILYIEDNMANLYLVRRVARADGHEVTNYIDGEEALANLPQDEPDLVLLDLQLAGDLTGLDVVEHMRANGNKTPVVAVTAYAMVGDRERCMAAGCDEYLAKPIQIPKLMEIFKTFAPEPGRNSIEPAETEPTSSAPAEQTEDTPPPTAKPATEPALPILTPKTAPEPEEASVISAEEIDSNDSAAEIDS